MPAETPATSAPPSSAPAALVTGGAGFIGSHLVERLLSLGHRVVIVDDLSTGRRENVEPLLAGGRCELIVAKADEALRTPALLRERRITQVYHLAAAVGVKLVVDDPAGMIRTNIGDTLTVLESCADAGAAVLVTSSSEVYGKCPTLPLREDMELVYGPTTASRWAYGMTKALDEHLAIDYARRRGLKAVVVRLFNTIGPRQVGRYGMVVPRFVAKALAGQPLEIYGDGNQTRAFCDARDVVRAMTGLLAEPACFGQVFNVGSRRQVTIDALADMVLALTGGTAGKRRVSYEAVYGEGFEDPPHRLPDTSKIEAHVGWQPKVKLEETLRELVALQNAASNTRGRAVATP